MGRSAGFPGGREPVLMRRTGAAKHQDGRIEMSPRKNLIMGAAVLLVLFLSAAFLAWTWSPGAWPFGLRVIVAVLSAIVAIMVICTVFED